MASPISSWRTSSSMIGWNWSWCRASGRDEDYWAATSNRYDSSYYSQLECSYQPQRMWDSCAFMFGGIIGASAVLVYNACSASELCFAATGQKNGHPLQSWQIFPLFSGWNTCNPRNRKNIPIILHRPSNPNQKPHDSETVSTPNPLSP